MSRNSRLPGLLQNVSGFSESKPYQEDSYASRNESREGVYRHLLLSGHVFLGILLFLKGRESLRNAMRRIRRASAHSSGQFLCFLGSLSILIGLVVEIAQP
jgi:hypothetical protein